VFFAKLTPKRRREGQLVLIICIIYLLLWLSIPKPAFWGLDNGYKFQGARAFAKTATLSVPYAGLSFDPNGSYRPIFHPFGIMNEGQQIPVFSVTFMILAGIFFWIFGSIGPFLLPLIGGWGCLIAAWFLWVRNRSIHDGRLYLLIFGLGSPLLFYSLTLWEHSLSLIPVIFAIAFLGRRKQERKPLEIWEVIASGALIAVAVSLRSEAIMWIPALLISWKWTGRKLDHVIYFILGFGLAIVMFSILNKMFTGSLIPLHLVTNVDLFSITSIKRLIITRLQNFYILMFEGFDQNLLSILGLVPLVLVLSWRAWRVKARHWWFIVAAVGAAWFMFIANHISQSNPIGFTTNSSGLLWISPIAVLGLLVARGENRHFWWMIWASSAIYILTIALATPKVEGVHWGPRFILQAFPFLLILAAARAQKWWKKYRPVRPVVIILVIISLLNQFYSIGLLWRAHDENFKLNTWAAETGPDVTITNILWLNGDLGMVSDMHPSYYARRQDAILKVLQGLRSQGYGKFHFLELPPYNSEELWNWVGAEKLRVDYVFEVGETNARIRRTTLKIIPGTGSP